MSRLVVVRIGPGASLQDLGRPGHAHEGVPPGGALVPELLAASNKALGNAPGCAALELPLHGGVFRALGALTIAIDGVPRRLDAGEELRVEAHAEAVRYVALPGGVDAPLRLGGRGTLAVAGLGSFLKKDDVLSAVTSEAARSNRVEAPHDPEAPIRVVPGPDDLGEAALEALFTRTFTLSQSMDRTGQRLEGALPVPGRDRRLSTPMVRGAIQVTSDGTPIVLGPDHPTTGGYPVIGVIVTADLGALARRRPGREVRFGGRASRAAG